MVYICELHLFLGHSVFNKHILFLADNKMQSNYKTMFEIHRKRPVISNPCYKGTILQRNYRKILLLSAEMF